MVYIFINKSIASIDSLSYLHIDEDNDPEDHNSAFSQHKREVIRQSIETNLKNAIDTFSSMSQALGSTYNYKMPIMLEEDWEKIYTEVSMTTFFQGLPIGFKTYNNYSIISVTGNNQFVNPELLYFIGNDGEYHKITCGNLTTTTGYRSIAFEQYKVQITKTNAIGEEDISDTVATYNYYYKHSETGDYDCIVQDKTESGVYKNGYFSDKLINPGDDREEKNATAYFTTLARERYNQYKATGYLNEEFDIATEDPTPVTGDNDFKYVVNLNSYNEKKVGVTANYSVTNTNDGETTEYVNAATYIINEGVYYYSKWEEEEKDEETINLEFDIVQTEIKDSGYYKIDDGDIIKAKISFSINNKNEDKEIILDSYNAEGYIVNNTENKNRYGDPVLEITKEGGRGSKEITININIYNTPRTYISTSADVDLSVILKKSNEIDLEPYIKDIKGEISRCSRKGLV